MPVHQRQAPPVAEFPQQTAYGQYGQSPQLFDDTSGAQQAGQAPNQPPQMFGQQMFGQQLLDNPAAMNMAMAYGGTLASSGKDYVDQNVCVEGKKGVDLT